MPVSGPDSVRLYPKARETKQEERLEPEGKIVKLWLK